MSYGAHEPDGPYEFLCFGEIFIQRDAFYFEEAGPNGLSRAETCNQRIAERLHFSSCYHALQFGNTETADVIVYIVEALAAYTLQDKVTIVAHFQTKTVAAKCTVFPLIAVILHPEVDALETVQICFVEVILVRFFALFGRNFSLFADDGAWQLQS